MILTTLNGVKNYDNSCTNELNQALKNIKYYYKVLEEMEVRSE